MDKTFHASNCEHNNYHVRNNNQKIKRQILRKNSKRKTDKNTSTRPLIVIRT